MDCFKILLGFITVFTMSTCLEHNRPVTRWTCKPDGIYIVSTFPKPFKGVIHTPRFFAIRNCSTPNMPAPKTKVVKLKLPLHQCNTKVKDRGNYTQVRNTLIIQHHHMITSIYDYSFNISCQTTKLSPEFWQLYRQRKVRPETLFTSSMEFALGPEVFGEIEAKSLEVSSKLFLKIYVKDGGKYADFRIRKCIVHNEELINRTTAVYTIAERNDCNGDVLNILGLINREPFKYDMVAFARVSRFNITNKGSLYISCGLDMCPKEEHTCPMYCPGRMVNNFTTIETYHAFYTRPIRNELLKRSGDLISEEQSTNSRRNLKTRNNLLRSTIKALSDRLLKQQEKLQKVRREAESIGQNIPKTDESDINKPESLSVDKSLASKETEKTYSGSLMKAEFQNTVNDEVSRSNVEMHLNDANLTSVTNMKSLGVNSTEKVVDGKVFNKSEKAENVLNEANSYFANAFNNGSFSNATSGEDLETISEFSLKPSNLTLPFLNDTFGTDSNKNASEDEIFKMCPTIGNSSNNANSTLSFTNNVFKNVSCQNVSRDSEVIRITDQIPIIDSKVNFTDDDDLKNFESYLINNTRTKDDLQIEKEKENRFSFTPEIQEQINVSEGNFTTESQDDKDMEQFFKEFANHSFINKGVITTTMTEVDVKDVINPNSTFNVLNCSNILPLNESKKHNKSITKAKYCLPMVTFLIVTISLSFVCFCSCLISIGCYLAFIKERKKQGLDTYLMYESY